MSDRSAAELAKELPYLHVPQGEAKIRSTMRGMDCFAEVWQGRWQVGSIALALRPNLEGTTPPPAD